MFWQTVIAVLGLVLLSGGALGVAYFRRKAKSLHREWLGRSGPECSKDWHESISREKLCWVAAIVGVVCIGISMQSVWVAFAVTGAACLIRALRVPLPIPGANYLGAIKER